MEGKRGEGDKSWVSPPGVHMLEQVTKQKFRLLAERHPPWQVRKRTGRETGGEKDMDEGTPCILETEGPF